LHKIIIIQFVHTVHKHTGTGKQTDRQKMNTI